MPWSAACSLRRISHPVSVSCSRGGSFACAIALLRESIHALVEAERLETARALGERDDEFMRLKVEGILECGELLVAALAPGRERHVFGRRTMPDMDLASVACAIQNLWLAARAEGIGMGWVSLFDPDSLRLLLRMPAGSRPVAVLCLGHVREFYPRPMLEMAQWAQPVEVDSLVHQDYWSEDGARLTARVLRQRNRTRQVPLTGIERELGFKSPGCPRNCRRCAPHRRPLDRP